MSEKTVVKTEVTVGMIVDCALACAYCLPNLVGLANPHLARRSRQQP